MGQDTFYGDAVVVSFIFLFVLTVLAVGGYWALSFLRKVLGKIF